MDGETAALQVAAVIHVIRGAGLITNPPSDVRFLTAYFDKAISLLAARQGGQLRIPMKQVPGRMAELDRDADLVIYCRSGARSGRLTAFLLANGFERVWNLEGGVLRWRQDIDPSLRAY